MIRLPERLEAVLFRLMLDLPGQVQRRIVGAPVRGSDGELAVESQALLWLTKVAHSPVVEELPLVEARLELERQARIAGGRPAPVETRDLEIPGPGGSLQARVYVPPALVDVAERPTLVFFHGGAMIYGSLDSHDAAVRHLAAHSGVQVISVEYRLAPEHPYPAPVEDCLAALQWVASRSDELRVDAARLGVGGDSAGGYFAAVTAIRAAELGLPLALQLLIYPVTLFGRSTPSREEFAEGFYLSSKFIDKSLIDFLPDPANLSDPLVQLGERESFPDGLAPAYVVTAGFDPLRDEGRDYAALLAEHGVVVEELRCSGMIHGFLNILAAGREAPAHNREIAAALGRLLGA